MLKSAESHILSTEGSQYPLRSLDWSGLPILDVGTVQADYGHLLVLTSSGALHGVNLDTGDCVELCDVALPAIEQSDNHFGTRCHRLHVSSDGSHAAIVVDYGRTGVVVDVRSGAITMHLNGGDYHENTVPFSACFLRHAGRNVLIHRTAWNRLDAADPATGESLADRPSTRYESGQEQPAHYLDYFHGQLHPSPDGSRLFDDGWVWQPASVPCAWSVSDWLASNPWESEDGPSVVYLLTRDDWDTPACWIGERHVALWGMAGWDNEEGDEISQGPGVRILDVTQSTQSINHRWPMESITNAPLSLLSDGKRLYVATDAGTTVWNIASRQQIAELGGFVARLYDFQRDALIMITPDSIGELPLAIFN